MPLISNTISNYNSLIDICLNDIHLLNPDFDIFQFYHIIKQFAENHHWKRGVGER